MTKTKTITSLTVMAISMLTVVGVLSFAQDSYATGIFYVGNSSGNLYILDIPAGTSTLIGNMGVVMTDVAIDPTTGNLWGISFTNLYSINKATAASTLIGSLGTGDSNALAFSDGGTAYEAGNSSTDLRTVNLTTGATTVVGNMGFASSGDMIWDTSLVMLWLSSSSLSDSLVLVDPTNAASNQKGAFGFSSVFGLGFDSGILYGTTTNGQLISINTTTGAGTLVTGIVNGIFGATDDRFVPEPGAIHILKFHDLNRDGIQDLPEEEGIPGWEVGIDCNENNNDVADTDEDGLVWFTDLLAPDDCLVSEEARDGWLATTDSVVQVELDPGDETVVEFGNVQVITASKSWTETDYTWEGNTETDDVLADELPTDDQGKFVAFAQVHQNGKYTGTNPGAMYALTTIEVLADIDALWVQEIYGECTGDDGILQFVSKKETRNVKVAIADSNDDVTELTDDLYNDVGGSIDATLVQADVHIEQPIEAGSTVYVLVKFKDNPSNIEVDDGEVDVMCDNVENVSADIFDQTVTVSVDASLRITNQE